MFNNYFSLGHFVKTAWRNVWRTKGFSIINIAGLALGMAGCILLLLNIRYELSIDQFHQKKDYLYKAFDRGIVDGKVESWELTAAPLATALKKDYPEIKDVARIAATGKLFSYADKKLNANGNYADASFLDMFSFPLVAGNKQTVLEDAHSVVITEKLAKKLFGNEEALDKVIRIDNMDNFTVTGILKNLPDNTRLQFEYLLPWKYLQAKNLENATWTNNYASTFVELQPSANIDALNSKLSNIIRKYDKNEQDVKVFLHPLTKLHLWDKFENGVPVGGNIDTVRMLCILAAVILVIACINFINLSTARSEKRSREVGVRKVMGAARKSLIFQFIAESLVLACIAGVFALMIVQLVLPSFSRFANVHINLAYNSPLFWLSFLLFVAFTGIIAGSYPAFYLSSFKPVKVLKGAVNTGKVLATPRKILVIIQFVFAIFLINFTVLFQKQIRHTESREIGFVQHNLLFHPLTDDLKKNYDLVKNDLLSSGAATAVSKSSTTVSRQAAIINGLTWQGADPKANSWFEYINTSGDFVKTNGLQLVAGRDIDMKMFPADSASCVINESAARLLHFKNPVGQTISESSTWTIVGVVKDFLIGSPDQQAGPMLIVGGNDANYISIKAAKASIQNINTITSVLKKYNPAYPTALEFAEEDYAAKFRHAKNVSVLINSFALIAIFISCLGLFGLSAYMAEKRKKEIGIRKVLGATIQNITALLTTNFLKLVVIAALVATPLAWWFMHFYLQQFSYRTTASWWIPVVTCAVSLLIAFCTISFQTIKVAVENPVKSLRTE